MGQIETGNFPVSIFAPSIREIAKVELFLASDESSFVNGTILTADAGLTTYKSNAY